VCVREWSSNIPENCLRVESCTVGVMLLQRVCVEMCGEDAGISVVMGAISGVRLACFTLRLVREGPNSDMVELLLLLRMSRGAGGLFAGVLFGSKIFAFGLRDDVEVKRIGPSPAWHPLTEG